MKKKKDPCCAALSIGGSICCEKPAGHKGKHRRTGNAGSAANPIPYVITWDGDFRMFSVLKE